MNDSPPTPPSDTTQSSAFFTAHAASFRQQYQDRPEFKERFDVWRQLLDKHGAHASSAIDVGCGAGTFSFLLAERGLSVTGIDGAPGMVELCQQQAAAHPHLKASFAHGRLPDLAGLDLSPADLVLSSSVLEYVPDFLGSLRKMRDLLKPDGRMLVSLPNSRSLYRKLESLAYRLIRKPTYVRYVVHRLSAEDFARQAESVGLRVLDLVFYAKADPISRTLASLGLPPARHCSLFVTVLSRRP